MLCNAAFGREVAAGDRLDRVKRFIAKHLNSASSFRLPASSARSHAKLEPGSSKLYLFQLSFQQPPQLLFRTMEVRLDRAERQLQRLREILVPHAVQIMRRHEQPVVGWQPCDGLLEPVAQLEIAELTISTRGRDGRRSLCIVERYRRRRRPLLRADVRDDPVDAGRELSFAAEVRQTAVDPKKYLLS